MKEKIEQLLMSTERHGICDLIAHMEMEGFFEAPCSGAHHLSKEGGLAEHSLNVYEIMKRLNKTLDTRYTDDTIILCAILHDLGKMGDHGKPNYVPYILKSGKQSDVTPYKTNPDLPYVDHEIRSVTISRMYISLTEEEEQAILWHNGLYGIFKYEISGKETPLYLLLHMADMWASIVVEKEDNKDETV